MSRRKSKRRSSSLGGGLAAAVREGHGKAGSDGPFPLVGNDASRPRKSWTWVPNSGFWVALAIPVAIVAVAGLAVGGAGGEGVLYIGAPSFFRSACLPSGSVLHRRSTRTS